MQDQDSSCFLWHELHTSDPTAASDFYGKVFGWSAEDVSSLGRPYLTLKVDTEPVGGILPKSASAFGDDNTHPRWMGYVQVDDAAEFLARATRDGGEIRRSAQDIAGLGRFAVVADPKGALFVVFQPLHPGASLRHHEVLENRFAWAELLCTDCPSQFQFYSSAFGWREKKNETGDLTESRTFTTNGTVTGHLSVSKTDQHASEWIFHVKVADITEAIRTATEAGGTVIDGPKNVDDGRRAVRCLDPEGVMFGMVHDLTTKHVLR